MMRTTLSASLLATSILLGCDGQSARSQSKAVAPAKPAMNPATLPGDAVTGDGKELGEGIRAWTLTAGSGAMLSPTANMATFKIRGWSGNGTQFFGQEMEADELILPCDDATAFPGWSTAISDMRIGERRKVWFSGTDQTRWPVTGDPTPDLVMDIELVEFDDTTTSDALPGVAVGDAARQGDSSGLRWYDIVSTQGVPLAEGDRAKIAAMCWLADGTPVAQSGTAPVVVQLDSALMPALTAGLSGMQPGSVRKLIVPPSLGVGFNPLGGAPAGTTLVIDVHYLGPDSNPPSTATAG